MPARTSTPFDRSDNPRRGAATSIVGRVRSASQTVVATALDTERPIWDRFSPLLLLAILSTLPLVAATSGSGSLFGAWLAVAYLLGGYLWIDLAIARADRSHQWRAFVLAGSGVTVISLALPTSASGITSVAIGLGAAGAIFAGIRLHAPLRPIPWYLLATALVLAELGHLGSTIWDVRADSPPAGFGIVSLAGLALLPVALWIILLRRSRGSSRSSLLDTAIVSTGLATLAWVYMIAPDVSSSASPAITPVVRLGWPLLGLAALVVAVRFLLTRWPDTNVARQFAGSALVLIIASIAAAAVSWADAPATTPESYPSANSLWLLALVGFGAAALHPSMAHLATPIREQPEELTWQRILLLTLALLLAPVALLTQLQRSEHPTIEVIAGASLLLGVLFAARLVALQRTRTATLAIERLLRRSAADLVGSSTRDEIADVAIGAARTIASSHVTSSLYLSEGVPGEFINQRGPDPDRGAGCVFRERDLARATLRRMLAGKPAWLDADDIDILRGPLGLDDDVDLVAIVPIGGRHGLHGFMLGAGSGLTPDGVCHLESLTALLALALDRHALAGEPNLQHTQHAIRAQAADGTSFTFTPVATPEPTPFDASDADDAGASVSTAPTLSAALRDAIEHDRLIARYQPRLDLTRGRIVSVEMTAAWESPLVGPIPGNALAAIAAEHGLSQPLRLGLLLRACRQTLDWQARHPGRTLDVVLPLSLSEIDTPGVAEDVGLALAETGCDPARVVLQFSAATLLDASEAARSELTAIATIGVGLAVSEAGASWSELARLSTLPVNLFELEAALINRVDSDARASSIAQHLIAHAHNRGAAVVAHGVDRREQWVHLRKLVCDLGQGTLFSPPVDADGISTLLSRAEQRSS